MGSLIKARKWHSLKELCHAYEYNPLEPNDPPIEGDSGVYKLYALIC